MKVEEEEHEALSHVETACKQIVDRLVQTALTAANGRSLLHLEACSDVEVSQFGSISALCEIVVTGGCKIGPIRLLAR